MMHEVKRPDTQQGVALAVALIILVGVTVVSLSMLATSMLEVVMAGSDEARTTAFQKAEAGIDAVASDTNNLQVIGNVGYKNCTSGFASKYGGTCNATSVALPNDYDATGSEISVRREAPLEQCPPRAMSTSCDSFGVATFSLDSRFDATQSRGGRVELTQGYMLLVPKTDQGG
jgi:Tfp pilus assembly protein PilX